jgi:CRP-like cAMP-binding protein
LKGQVRISVTSAEGKEIVLNIVRPGEVFGEIALLDGRPRSADAVTMTDCDVLVLDRREFIPFIKAHPDVALKLIEVLCARLRRTSEQVEDMLFLDLAARLAKTLLRLSRDLKSTTIAITQKDLGQMVGLSRESTNKQLRAWERRNWVKLVKGGVALTDTEALGEIAAADETEE